jgi:hypothetical protein
MKFLFAVLLIPVCGFASPIVTIANHAPTSSGSSLNESSSIDSPAAMLSSTDHAASTAEPGQPRYGGEIKAASLAGAKFVTATPVQGQSVTSNGFFNPAPEPGSLGLIGLGLLGLAAAGAVKARLRNRV